MTGGNTANADGAKRQTLDDVTIEGTKDDVAVRLTAKTVGGEARGKGSLTLSGGAITGGKTSLLVKGGAIVAKKARLTGPSKVESGTIAGP